MKFKIIALVLAITLLAMPVLSAVKLGWEIVNNPTVQYYGIYRAIDDSTNFVKIAEVPQAMNTYTDSTALIGHIWYAATSITFNGDESAFSNTVDTTFYELLPPDSLVFLRF